MPSNTVEVHGIIRDRDGVGVKGVDVGFLRDGENSWRTQRTDRKGAYRMRLRAGVYQPILSAHHVRVPTVFLDTIVIASPSAEFNYRYTGFRIEGRLMGPGGKPVESGTLVALASAPDNDSRAESELLKNRYTVFVPPQAYWFITTPKPTYLPSIKKLGKGISISSDTTIDFSADGNLVTGKVLLGSRTVPRKVEIEARASIKDLEVSAYDKIGADGSYHLYLPDGKYAFSLRPGPATRFIIGPRSLSYEVTAPRTINLDFAVGEWTGTVRDSLTRAPVKSIQVIAADAQRNGVSAVSETDGRGRFRLALDPGSTYELLWSKNHGNTRAKLIPGVFAGRDSSFDILVRITR